MWELKIEKIVNGFILSREEEREENKAEVVKETIEEGDDERETMTRLLERVSGYFGIHYDKYAKNNLNITWNKKGRKL
jgi:hypothetical protein